MRIVVALDTATEHVALALGDLDAPDTVVTGLDFAAPRAANTTLLPALERLIAEAGLEMADVAAVACGCGPGSFTGVRIAVATAKGLAHGLGVPLVGFGTLDAVAWRVIGDARAIGVLGDAMRGEVYPARFEVERGRIRRLDPDRVARPEDVAREWAAASGALLLTGNGLRRYSEVVTSILGESATHAEESRWTPDAASLLRAAWSVEGPQSLTSVAPLSRETAFRAAHPQLLLPIYTRLSDAEEAERLRSAEYGTAR